MRWAGHISRIGKKRNAYRIFVGNEEAKKRPLGTIDVGGRIILKRILKREFGVVWTGLNWLRIGTSGRLL
jgi:hypothetical protein